MPAFLTFCEQCGARIRVEQRYCEQCGAALHTASNPVPAAEHPDGKLTPREPGPSELAPGADSEITWIDRSPILGCNIATKQLALIVVLSLVVMQLAVGTMGWLVNDRFLILPWQVFAIGGGSLIVLMLIAILILGNSVNTTITVNDVGLRFEMGSRARGLARMTAAAGSPAAAGAGLLAASRSYGLISWADVARARINHRRRSFTLYDATLPLIEVGCTPEVFDRVTMIINRHVSRVDHVACAP